MGKHLKWSRARRLAAEGFVLWSGLGFGAGRRCFKLKRALRVPAVQANCRKTRTLKRFTDVKGLIGLVRTSARDPSRASRNSPSAKCFWRALPLGFILSQVAFIFSEETVDVSAAVTPGWPHFHNPGFPPQKHINLINSACPPFAGELWEFWEVSALLRGGTRLD
ncbi:hypothetical protein AOLI_G00059270 [Acnodon oligacanthus]